MNKQRKINWRTILTVITFAALAAFIYALRKQILTTFQNLENLNLWLLVLMLPFQLMHYHFVTLLYRHLFRMLGNRVNYRFLFRMALELNFVNLVFPSAGVSGFSYFGYRLRSQDVKAGKSTLVQTMRFVLLFVAFQILLSAGLIILAIDGKANDFMILVAGSLATFLFLGTLILIYIIGSESRIETFFTFLTKTVNRAIQVVRRNNPETISIERARGLFKEYHGSYLLLKENYRQLKRPVLYALGINLGEVLTIYTVFAAFGQWVNPGSVIIGYAVANFAGLISVLPGGIGIYEALMTGVLAAGGVPAALSLPVVIAYRVISISIQLPPGAYYYHRAINETADDA